MLADGSQHAECMLWIIRQHLTADFIETSWTFYKGLYATAEL